MKTLTQLNWMLAALIASLVLVSVPAWADPAHDPMTHYDPNDPGDEYVQDVDLTVPNPTVAELEKGVRYFQHKADTASSDRKRRFWLQRKAAAEGSLGAAREREKQEARGKAQAAVRAVLPEIRATVEILKKVGDKALLNIAPGSRPADSYQIIGRVQGETGVMNHGGSQTTAPYQYVADMREGVVYEFAVRSTLSNQSIVGPWASTQAGTRAEAEAQRQAEIAAADERRRQAEQEVADHDRAHAEKMAAQERERLAELKRQEEEARKNREAAERERERQRREHEWKVSQLPKSTPVDVQGQVHDFGTGTTVRLDLQWTRGERIADHYFVKVNGTVVSGDELNGVKPAGHRWEEQFRVYRAAQYAVEIYGSVEGVGPTPSVSLTLNAPALPPPSPTTALAWRSADVGGGRFGFASAIYAPWGVTRTGGSLEQAEKYGVRVIYEARPGKGENFFIGTTDTKVKSVIINGRRVLVRWLTRLGTTHLYTAPGHKVDWPTRDERANGIDIVIER